MLPISYKFKVRNDAGVTTTVTTSWRPYKVGSGGALTYASAAAPQSAVSLASAASDVSAAVDNSSALNHGGHLTLTVNPGSTPTGNKAIYLYLVRSDGTTYGDEEYQLGAIVMTTSGVSLSASFEVPV